MTKLNLLIIGSNFGKYHLKSSLKSKKFENISISSPNILKKRISKNVHKFENFKFALKNTKIDMLTVVTKPNIQNNVLKFIYKEKIFPKLIFLEKPIFNSSLDIIKKFPKKSKIITNFIFAFDKKWNYLKNKINVKKSNYKFEYEWYFKQAYFNNNRQTWKTKPSEGGGLINYYLPHAIYNILNIFENIKIIKISKKKYYKNILIYLEVIFIHKGERSILKINNNSNKNLHKFKLINTKNNNTYEIHNDTKKWLSNFQIVKNNNKIIKFKKERIKNDGREEVLEKVYSKIKYFFHGKFLDSNKSLTYKTFKLINKINSKINET